MRVRNAAMILGAVLAGTVAVNQAKAIPYPTSPFVKENVNSMLVASFPTEAYNPDGDAGNPNANDGVFTVTLDPGFLNDSGTGAQLDDAVFDVKVYINKNTGVVDGGSVNIGGYIEGNPDLSDKVYFYSTSIDAFGLDDAGNTLKALFTQENAPGGTDQTYAAIGQSVGLVIILPSVEPVEPTIPGTGFTNDLNSPLLSNFDGTQAKATGQPVPEPVSTLLLGLSLSGLGLGVTRRRSSL